MFCCITSRQLHNSPIYIRVLASGHIHTLAHVAQLSQNKQSQQGWSGANFLFDLSCFLMTGDVRRFCSRTQQRQNENGVSVMGLLEV